MMSLTLLPTPLHSLSVPLKWAQNEGDTVTHGWKPEGGFLPYRWQGYDEATILYLLGLGSPTHPLPAESYPAYTSTYCWKSIYDREFLYAGLLFIHQYFTCGSNFATSRTRICVAGVSITSRAAGGRPTSSSSMRPATRSGLTVIASADGASRPATVPVPQPLSSTVSIAFSSITPPEARPAGLTMAPSPPGPRSPRCPSHRRSSCRRSSI